MLKLGLNLRHCSECLSMLISLSIWFWSKACTNYKIHLHNVMTHFATLLSQQNNVPLECSIFCFIKLPCRRPEGQTVIFISPNGTPRFTDSFKGHSNLQIYLDMTPSASCAYMHICSTKSLCLTYLSSFPNIRWKDRGQNMSGLL